MIDIVKILSSEGWDPVTMGPKEFSRPCDQCGNDGDMNVYVGHKGLLKSKTVVKCPRCNFLLDIVEEERER